MRNQQPSADPGQQNVVSRFNILKDSVRGHKDLEQRNSELLKKEKEFFETLDLISKEKEQVLNDKPFLYKAVFTGSNDFIVER